MAIADKVVDASWMKPVTAQLVRLFDLEEDWNSYGAPPIDPGTIGFGLSFLVRALQLDTPTPAVIASPSGGFQFEWHEQGIDLEVEVLPGGRFELYFGIPARCVEEELADQDLATAVEFAGDRIKTHLHSR